tara:strand:+ start:76 stop:690 length:615 start_codon:yes stop_codon:yes gene_type:complete
MANKIEDRLVSGWASDEKRTLLDLATGGRFKTSEDLPEIKEKVIPGIEFLTGAYRGEEPSMAALAMAAPIAGKGVKAVMPVFKTIAKTTKDVYKRWLKAANIVGVSDDIIRQVGELALAKANDMKGFINLLRPIDRASSKVIGKGYGITKTKIAKKQVKQVERIQEGMQERQRVISNPKRIEQSRKEAVKEGWKERKSQGVREY